MVEALLHTRGFAGSSEGHFLPLLAELDALVQGYYAQAASMGLLAIPENTISMIPQSELRVELVRLFERLHTKLFPADARLFDKTVNVQAIGALPYLLGVWPSAKILYLKRNGLENVESAEKKFKVELAVACKNWSFCGEEWERVKPLLREESYLVIDHNELSRDPEITSLRIAEHLSLDRSQTAQLCQFVVARAEGWTARRPKRPPLDCTGWSKQRLAVFLAICGRQMVRQGYASQIDIDALSSSCMPSETRLAYDAGRVLHIDDERFFQATGDGWFIVPGRDSAATLIFEKINVSGKRRLVGELLLAHPAAQPARVEFLVISADTGRLVLSGAAELTAMVPVKLSLPMTMPAERIDCIVRVALGIGSRTNDYAWVRMDRLAFVP